MTIFQGYEHLGDRAAVHVVCIRLDWNYALQLPLDDNGFDPSILSEFHPCLLTHQAEVRLFEIVLAQPKERGYLELRGMQRADSLAVLTRVRSLTRLEAGQPDAVDCRARLAESRRRRTCRTVPSFWHKRSGHRCRSKRLSAAQRAKHASEIGHTGHWLLATRHGANAALVRRLDLRQVLTTSLHLVPTWVAALAIRCAPVGGAGAQQLVVRKLTCLTDCAPTPMGRRISAAPLERGWGAVGASSSLGASSDEVAQDLALDGPGTLDLISSSDSGNFPPATTSQPPQAGAGWTAPRWAAATD